MVPDTTETRAAYAPVALVTLIIISTSSIGPLGLHPRHFITYRSTHSETLLITTLEFSARGRSRRFDPVTFTFTFVLKRRRLASEACLVCWRRRSPLGRFSPKRGAAAIMAAKIEREEQNKTKRLIITPQTNMGS